MERPNGQILVVNTTFDSGLNRIYTVTDTGSSLSLGYNYTQEASSSYLANYANPVGTINIHGSGLTWFVQWLRLRAYPPNGTMPVVSFNSLFQSTLAITIVVIVVIGGIIGFSP